MQLFRPENSTSALISAIQSTESTPKLSLTCPSVISESQRRAENYQILALEEKSDKNTTKEKTESKNNPSERKIVEPAPNVVTTYQSVRIDALCSIHCVIFRPKNTEPLRPNAKQTAETLPTFFYIPGTASKGFNQRVEKVICSHLSAELKCQVIGIIHRTTHQNKFPIPFNDICSALNYFLTSAETYNIDLQKIWIGGYSSGGLLAILILLYGYGLGAIAKSPFSRLILAAPLIHLDLEIAKQYPTVEAVKSSRKEYPDYIMTRSFFRSVYDNFIPTILNSEFLVCLSTILSPIKIPAERFCSFPPTVVIYGANENLAPEIEEFIEMLKEAKVRVFNKSIDKRGHDFFWDDPKCYMSELKKLLGEFNISQPLSSKFAVTPLKPVDLISVLKYSTETCILDLKSTTEIESKLTAFKANKKEIRYLKLPADSGFMSKNNLIGSLLGDNTTLCHLNLVGSYFPDSQKQIDGCTNIEWLTQPLKNPELNLTTLNLWGNSLGNCGLKKVANALFARHIPIYQRVSKLLFLGLGRNEITANSIKHLVDLMLDLSPESSPISLDLRINPIGIKIVANESFTTALDGATQLKRLINSSPTLTGLNIFGNRFNTEASKILVDAIEATSKRNYFFSTPQVGASKHNYVTRTLLPPTLLPSIINNKKPKLIFFSMMPGDKLSLEQNSKLAVDAELGRELIYYAPNMEFSSIPGVVLEYFFENYNNEVTKEHQKRYEKAIANNIMNTMQVMHEVAPDEFDELSTYLAELTAPDTLMAQKYLLEEMTTRTSIIGTFLHTHQKTLVQCSENNLNNKLWQKYEDLRNKLAYVGKPQDSYDDPLSKSFFFFVVAPIIIPCQPLGTSRKITSIIADYCQSAEVGPTSNPSII